MLGFFLNNSMNTTFCVKKQKKKKEEDLALREGLQPLVKLLSQVPKVNSFFHQLPKLASTKSSFQEIWGVKEPCVKATRKGTIQ
jgi:hypothetical protein